MTFWRVIVPTTSRSALREFDDQTKAVDQLLRYAETGYQTRNERTRDRALSRCKLLHQVARALDHMMDQSKSH